MHPSNGAALQGLRQVGLNDLRRKARGLELVRAPGAGKKASIVGVRLQLDDKRVG
jgi:hypothetical protein